MLINFPRNNCHSPFAAFTAAASDHLGQSVSLCSVWWSAQSSSILLLTEWTLITAWRCRSFPQSVVSVGSGAVWNQRRSLVFGDWLERRQAGKTTHKCRGVSCLSICLMFVCLYVDGWKYSVVSAASQLGVSKQQLWSFIVYLAVADERSGEVVECLGLIVFSFTDRDIYFPCLLVWDVLKELAKKWFEVPPNWIRSAEWFCDLV